MALMVLGMNVCSSIVAEAGFAGFIVIVKGILYQDLCLLLPIPRVNELQDSWLLTQTARSSCTRC